MPLTPRPRSLQVAVLRSAEISDAERSTTMAVFRLPLNVLVVVVLLLVPLLREEFVFGLAVRTTRLGPWTTHTSHGRTPLSPLPRPTLALYIGRDARRVPRLRARSSGARIQPTTRCLRAVKPLNGGGTARSPDRGGMGGIAGGERRGGEVLPTPSPPDERLAG